VLPCKIRLLGIGLGTDGDVFAGSHRHCARREAGNARHDNCAMRRTGGSYADNKAGGGDNPIVGTQNGRTRPAYMLGAMALAPAVVPPASH
jgi:hypothetical protein